MYLHASLSVRVVAAILSLGTAGTSFGGVLALSAVPTEAPSNHICIANSGDGVAVLSPSPASAKLDLTLMLPKGADADKISVLPPTDWTISAREFQPAGRALVFSLTPARSVELKGRSLDTCFEVVGIRTDELGAIGLGILVPIPEETAAPVRR